jgi:hypothetical protein
VGIPEATLPAETRAGIVPVGIPELIVLGEMLQGILKVPTGPELEVGRVVRQVGPLWVVRKVDNDHNRPRGRGQAV